MNLIQRMVAENVEYVTSVELAEASSVSHEDVCRLLEEYQPAFDRVRPLERQNDSFVLTVMQAMFAATFLPIVSINDAAFLELERYDYWINDRNVYDELSDGEETDLLHEWDQWASENNILTYADFFCSI